jgi:hypothetical protein
VAELTTLEEKLAEVLGLAQAAQGATEKVETEAAGGKDPYEESSLLCAAGCGDLSRDEL